MVKVGFIVEGDTERIIVESAAFEAWLNSIDIELCRPVIDAKGGGNLLPDNIEPMVQRLRGMQVEHIVILTDLEDDPTVDEVKSRIGTAHTELVYVAVKAIEAWYLADSAALTKWLGVPYEEAHPEATVGKPWDRLKEIAAELNRRGPGNSKPGFAKKMVKHHGFTIPAAAAHTDCPSATSFCDGLKLL